MIINLRGPCGAGKTTLVKRVMELYTKTLTRREDGRKQPLGYLMTSKRDEAKKLAIIGHYEGPTGGSDPIAGSQGYGKLYDLVKQSAVRYDTLYEGLLISEDTKQTRMVLNDLPVIEYHAIFLDTSLEVCLQSVAQRRAEGGRNYSKPLNVENVTGKWEGLRRTYAKMSAMQLQHKNLHICWTDREGAYDLICKLLVP